MIKIKICGLQTLMDIESANTYMPDFVGFVFAPSKRNISKAVAKQMKQELNPQIKSVGVFVDENTDVIMEYIEDNIIDIVQLHGNENSEYIKKLKKKNIIIINATPIKRCKDIEKVNSIDCDYLLFDAYSPNAHGGTGQTFNWNSIKHREIDKPYFLAGGINETNIMQAMNVIPMPYCIDVSSGVETKGTKDRKKMKNIIELLRNHMSKSFAGV